MLTTSGPAKRPAARQARLVRYIGTFEPVCQWRTGKPAATSALSNVNEQPNRKATKSSRHSGWMSVGSRTSGSPRRKTR